MREIIYEFNTLGSYQTSGDTAFGQETHLKITVEPHDFSIAVGGEILRKSACKGYEIEVSSKGEAVFWDREGKELCRVQEQGQEYKEVRLLWKRGSVSLQFGKVEWIDNYPNCDGEHDRWDQRWRTEYEVTLNEETNTLSCKAL